MLLREQSARLGNIQQLIAASQYHEASRRVVYRVQVVIDIEAATGMAPGQAYVRVASLCLLIS